MTSNLKTKNNNCFNPFQLVIAFLICSAAALVLIPSVKGFVKDSKISLANQNANMVYTAAKACLVRYNKQNGTIDTKGITTDVYQYSESNAVSLGDNVILNLQPYLNDSFAGYFAFVTASSGSDIKFALWSEEPFTDISQLSAENQAAAAGDDFLIQNIKITGCYPLIKTKIS